MYRIPFLTLLTLAVGLPWPNCLFAASTDTHQMIRPRTQGDTNLSGPLPVFWNFLLLDLPLPDKRGQVSFSGIQEVD